MAEVLGSAAVQVGANLDPLSRDLDKARGQVEQFTSTAQRSIDQIGTSTTKAKAAQEGFNQSLKDSNVIYVDFNNNIRKQSDGLRDVTEAVKGAGQETKSFSERVRDVAERGHAVTEVLKVSAAAALLFSQHARTAALSLAGMAAGTAAGGTLAVLPTVVGGALTALQRMSPVLGPIALGFAAIKLASEAASTGVEKVAELTKLYSDSLKAGVDPILFSASKKAAEELKLDVDALTSAFTKLKELTKPSAEGTQLDTIVKSLKDLEQLNKGDTRFSLATDPREQLDAIASTIREMMASGQKLAALDLAAKIWPPEVVANMARSSDFLDRMLDATRKAAQESPISSQTVIRAKELQDRLDAAYKTLHAAFLDLTSLGLTIRGVWVSIVEVAAAATAAVGNMLSHAVDAVREVARAGQEAGRTSTTRFSGVGLGTENLTSVDMLGVGEGVRTRTAAERAADAFLAGNLPRNTAGPSALESNPAVMQSAAEMGRTMTKVWGDASDAANKYTTAVSKLDDMMPSSIDKQRQLNKQLDAAKKAYDEGVDALKRQAGPGEVNRQQLDQLTETYKKTVAGIKQAASESDAFNRAVENTARHIAIQEAMAKSINDGAGAMAKMRVEAQLTEVALSQGLDPKAGKTADTIKRLSDRAAEAAQNIAMVRLQSDMAFDKQQLGRTDTEQAVAARLRNVVGTTNVPAAMQSALGQQLTMLENLRQARDLSVNFASSFAQSFSSALQQGANGWEAFKKAGLNALISLQSQLLDIIAKNLMQKAFGSLIGGGFGFGTGGVFSTAADAGMGGADAIGSGGLNFIDVLMPKALGGAFISGVEKFSSGGVVTGPRLFRAANGLGVMGEAGPEAIMPLRRGPDGRLGVSLPDGGGGGPVVSIQQFFDFRGAETGVEARVRAMSPEIIKRSVDASVKAVSVANRNNPRYLSK